MSIDYLKRLNDRYEEWISGYTEGKLLVLNVDDLDYKSNADDTAFVIQKVSEALGI